METYREFILTAVSMSAHFQSTQSPIHLISSKVLSDKQSKNQTGFKKLLSFRGEKLKAAFFFDN